MTAPGLLRRLLTRPTFFTQSREALEEWGTSEHFVEIRKQHPINGEWSSDRRRSACAAKPLMEITAAKFCGFRTWISTSFAFMSQRQNTPISHTWSREDCACMQRLLVYSDTFDCLRGMQQLTALCKSHRRFCRLEWSDFSLFNLNETVWRFPIIAGWQTEQGTVQRFRYI